MSIVLTSRSGADSKLHLEIPVDQPDAEFTVEVVVRPKPPRKVPKLGTQRGSVLSMEHFDDPLEDFREYTE